MSSPRPLTARQQREAAFYAQYAARQRVDAVDYAPVEGRERRPWNPYWYVYEQAVARQVNRRQKLLDFGCGAGLPAVRFAHAGFETFGFDLSPDNIRLARDLATREGLTDRCRFEVGVAEQLDYLDNTFDVIAGIDILHHVEIRPALAEAYRVLKPGGLAIFKEHVEAPFVEPVRNSALFRTLAPRTSSLDEHITDDERKLTAADVRTLVEQFDAVDVKRFTLVARLERLLPRTADTTRGRLQRLDARLLSLCPPLARLGGTAVFLCRKAAA